MANDTPAAFTDAARRYFQIGDELTNAGDPAQRIFVLPPGATVLTPAQAQALADDQAGGTVSLRKRPVYFDGTALAKFRFNASELERIANNPRGGHALRATTRSGANILRGLADALEGNAD